MALARRMSLRSREHVVGAIRARSKNILRTEQENFLHGAPGRGTTRHSWAWSAQHSAVKTGARLMTQLFLGSEIEKRPPVLP